MVPQTLVKSCADLGNAAPGSLGSVKIFDVANALFRVFHSNLPCIRKCTVLLTFIGASETLSGLNMKMGVYCL